MTKQKTTKRALLLSALALLSCVTMLIGSTFAWFTDSVTSAGNKIQAGTLDVQLLMDLGDVNGYTDISNSAKPIFGADSLLNEQDWWEPGKTEVAYLAIKNNGSLALKYKVALNVIDVTKELHKAMEYAIVPDAKKGDVTAWNDGLTVVEGLQPVSGDVSLGAGATHYFALAIHMNEDAGNQYQDGKITFDLTVLATQDTVEADSFGTDYDAFADYDGEISDASSLTAALKNGGNYKVVGDFAVAEPNVIPAGVVVNLDLNGKTITGTGHKSVMNGVFVNNGTATIVGGTITSTADNGGSAIVNKGTLTVKDATLNGAPNAGGSWPSYTVNNTGVLEINDSYITSVHGAVASYNAGATVTLNNTDIDMSGIPTFTSHALYTYSGGTIVVNSGNIANHALDQAATDGSVINGAIIANGGTFSGRIVNYYAQPVLKGGTYSVNPKAAFVADGYTTLANVDGTYSVVECTVYDKNTMGDLYTFLPTLNVGDVLVLPAGLYETTGTFKVAAGVTIKGENGKTVTIRQNSAQQDDIFDCVGDARFENINFESNRKGYAITDTSKNHDTDGDLTVINCKFKGIAAEKNYGIYKNLYGNLTVKNCTFDTYNNALCGISNGGDSATVIIGCTFKNINGEAIGYVTSTMPADFEAEVIAGNTGLTAENVIGY